MGEYAPDQHGDRAVIDISIFGSAERPLRASSLPKLVGCPLSLVHKVMFDDDKGGKAADTGSAMHKAAAAWHINGHDIPASLAEMIDKKGEYPLADMTEAARIFQRYCEDIRNIQAKTILVEEKVEIILPPSPEDKTGKEIVITGTLDQVREYPGGDLALVDIKTGESMDGGEMLMYYAMQQALYQVGAAKKLSRRVRAAFILRTRDYFKRGGPGPVLYEAPWTDTQAAEMLDGLRLLVASIRNGVVHVSPGLDCFRCHLNNPSVCLPELKTLGVKK